MVVRVPPDSPLPSVEAKDAGVWAIDYRETSPANSDKGMYGSDKAGRDAAQVGGLAVGVPGELRGLEMGESIYTRFARDADIQRIRCTEHYRGKTSSCL